MFFIDEDEIVIKCKKDLINTYIENDFGELRNLYLAKCESVGLKINLACLSTKSEFIFVKERVGSCGNVDHSTSACYLNIKYGHMKKLTLSDLKPRTRTEYEKVTESIFDLHDEFERGELHNKSLDCSGDFVVIKSEVVLLACGAAGNIYRRIETPITWQDELEEFLNKKAHDGAMIEGLAIDSESNEFGCVSMNMSLRFGDFIEMCRLVSKLTDKE